jgi:bifunctional DNA-binding transcriptional regulator/antitoxin component of YhaV-PrlF toxin-antitoxin module
MSEKALSTIKLTSKRQATLPKSLCDELGLAPGDEIRIERREIGDEAVWVLRQNAPDTSWIGALSRYAKGKRHDPKSLRASIGKAVGRKTSRGGRR